MKQTWSEIQIDKCIKIGKKYRVLKLLMALQIILFFFLGQSTRFLRRNRRKLVSFSSIVIVFIVGNSFSFPQPQEEIFVVQTVEGESLTQSIPVVQQNPDGIPAIEQIPTMAIPADQHNPITTIPAAEQIPPEAVPADQQSPTVTIPAAEQIPPEAVPADQQSPIVTIPAAEQNSTEAVPIIQQSFSPQSSPEHLEKEEAMPAKPESTLPGSDTIGLRPNSSKEERKGDLSSQTTINTQKAEGKTKTTISPKSLAAFRRSDWQLILINKQRPVPEHYTFKKGRFPVSAAAGRQTESLQCDLRIIPELLSMLNDAKSDGVNLIVCSAYRDVAYQAVLFNRKIDLYLSQGNTYMEAYKRASQIVTIPGTSEHQAGLALDIISDQYSLLDKGFGETKAGRWLAEHSKEYGFILRYPEGKEYITGIEYEPWHFRYVGKEAATLMMNTGLTLEEFVERISE